MYISFLCLDKMTFVHPSFMCLNFISSFNLGSYVPLILYLCFHYVLCKFIHCIHLLNEAYLCVSILVLESLWNWTLEFMKTRKGNLTLIFFNLISNTNFLISQFPQVWTMVITINLSTLYWDYTLTTCRYSMALGRYFMCVSVKSLRPGTIYGFLSHYHLHITS